MQRSPTRSVVRKVLHRRFYDCLTSNTSLGLFFAGVFVTIVAALLYGESVIKLKAVGIEYAIQTNKDLDNLAGRSFADKMCSPTPIDVVYTWVNGSDPQLLADLAAVKLQLEIAANLTREANETATRLEALKAQAASETPSLEATTAMVTTAQQVSSAAGVANEANESSAINGSTLWNSSWVGPPLPYLWDLKFTDELSVAVSGLQRLDPSIIPDKKAALATELARQCGSVDHVALDDRGVAAIVVFEDAWSVQACVGHDVQLAEGNNVSLGPVHFVGNESFNGLIPIVDSAVATASDVGFAARPELAMMVSGVPDHMEDDTLLTLVSAFGNSSIIHRYMEAGLAVIEYQERMGVINALDMGSCGVNDGSSRDWEFEPHISTLLEQAVDPGEPEGAGNGNGVNEYYAGGDDMWPGWFGDDGYNGGYDTGRHRRGRHLTAAVGDGAAKVAKGPTKRRRRRTTTPRGPVVAHKKLGTARPSTHKTKTMTATKPVAVKPTHRLSKRRKVTRPSTQMATTSNSSRMTGSENGTLGGHNSSHASTETDRVVNSTSDGQAVGNATRTRNDSTTMEKNGISADANALAGTTSPWNYTLYFLPVVRVGAVENLTSELVDLVEKSAQGSSGTQEESDGDEPDEISSSRFQDNSELQYSLRSIEKFAPWVRHIYIVTNGQIPSWLDLNHPRISIVTHSDIFSNQSHLPVFSSPAIEAHLHKIPGLSKKFVYLNDDVMFGTDIYPDDFYTHLSGQKVYEAWPVPNCVEACPSNWINDKYCDAACNNAECDWDGDDCKKNNAEQKAPGTQHTTGQLCAAGCSDGWLGDKFCDKTCNNVECGMDGGDCGIDSVVSMLPGYVIDDNETDVWHVEENGTFAVTNPTSLYLNLSSVFDQIDSGYHDSPDALNGAVVFQEHQTLIIVVRPQLNYTVVNFTLEGYKFTYEEFVEEEITTTQTTTDVDNDDPERLALLEMNETNTTRLKPTATNESFSDDNVTDAIIAAWDGSANVTNATLNSTDTDTPKLVRRDHHVVLTLSLHVMTAVDDDVIILNETLLGNSTNDTATDAVPVRIIAINETTLNFWEIPENVSSTNATGNTTTERPWLVPPNISDSLLTNETKRALDELQKEFEEGELTAKGLAKYRYKLLEPYTDTVSTPQFRAGRGYHPRRTSTAPRTTENHRRKLHQIDDWNQGSTANDEPAADLHSPFVQRGGMWVLREDAELAEWIADQKRKQFSYADDMQASIRAWELNTGRKWTNTTIPLKERSPFPWERLGTFDSLLSMVGGDEASAFEFDPERWRSRLPKDTFGNSLKKVNRLYNKVFGFKARKVIAHMPHFIDRDIMQDLVDKFPDEWENTSSHRLRSGDDMQYAFAYYRYLMELPKNFSIAETFAEYDLDHSGILSVHELRTLITRLYDLPTSLDNWKRFETMLLNCSEGQTPMDTLGVGIGPNSKEIWVTLDFVLNCSELESEIKRAKGTQYVYKHELRSDEHDISFEMIRDNVTIVLDQLDAIRRNPQKFVCLNDNIDHRKKSAIDVVEALQNFYQSFFPIRSKFELPIGLRNRFLHMQELRAWQKRQEIVYGWSKRVLVAVTIFILVVLYSGRVKRWRRSWLLGRRRNRIFSMQSFERTGPGSSSPEYATKRA